MTVNRQPQELPGIHTIIDIRETHADIYCAGSTLGNANPDVPYTVPEGQIALVIGDPDDTMAIVGPPRQILELLARAGADTASSMYGRRTP